MVRNNNIKKLIAIILVPVDKTNNRCKRCLLFFGGMVIEGRLTHDLIYLSLSVDVTENKIKMIYAFPKGK